MSVMFQTVLWETEVLDFHKLSRARLPMEVKYAVKFSIPDIFKFYRE